MKCKREVDDATATPEAIESSWRFEFSENKIFSSIYDAIHE